MYYHGRPVDLGNASTPSEKNQPAFANQKASGKDFRLCDLFDILMKSGDAEPRYEEKNSMAWPAINGDDDGCSCFECVSLVWRVRISAPDVSLRLDLSI